MGASGKRIGAIARELGLGLGETALRRWVRQGRSTPEVVRRGR